jgi:drug/metabolite transporter (DMT)-like permease
VSALPPSNPIVRFAPPPALAGPMAMFCWAFSMIVVKEVAGVVPPAALSFFRCLIAVVLLYFLCGRNLHAQLPLMRKHWKIIGLLGFCLFVGGNGMLFVGLQFTTAINAALINSAEPVTIVAVAWLMFRDRLTPIQWFGVGLSLAGVIYLIGRGKLETLLSFSLNIGDVFILISITTWAFYAVLLRKVPRELDRLNLVFGILVAGSVLVCPFWILENIYYKPTPFGWDLAWATGFNAVFASILAMFWWNHAVEGLGPGRAGLFVHLIPVYTVFLAMWFLDEELYWFHAVGIGLIAAGIFFTTLLKTGPKKEAVH